MAPLITFVLGLCVGSSVTIFSMALMGISKLHSEDLEDDQKRRSGTP